MTTFYVYHSGKLYWQGSDRFILSDVLLSLLGPEYVCHYSTVCGSLIWFPKEDEHGNNFHGGTVHHVVTDTDKRYHMR